MKIKILRELIEPKVSIDNLAKKEEMYSAGLMHETLLNDGVIFEEFVEDFKVVYSDPNSPNEEYAKSFYKGLAANPALEYLTLFSIEELKQMYLIMPEDLTSGMACTVEGHMGSGWNNSSRRGVLNKLMNFCMSSLGGKTGDHFDGGLGGYYKSLGLTKVYKISFWNDDYAPKNWNYKPVDIFNPKKSVYAEGFEQFDKSNPDKIPNEEMDLVVESGFLVKCNPYQKMVQYANGMPDVIYRSK